MSGASVDGVRLDGGAAPRWRLPSRRAVLWGVIAVAMLLIAALVGWRLAAADDGLRLEVWDMGAGDIVYARPIELGESFRLEHTHSVTKRPVVETFGVGMTDAAAPTVLLQELRFDEFGPNLPAGPESFGDHKTTFIHEDGAYRVLHHNYPIGTIPIRVGSADVDHTLIFADGERLRLLDVVRRGEHAEFAVNEG